MANQKHMDLLKQGVAQWNAWREQNQVRPNQRQPNLSGADLRGANLREADLSEANLGKANLGKVDLSGANLSGANLRRADLNEANLRGANLRRADLNEADLRRADLHRANLAEANLSGAKLSGSYLSGGRLGGVDLSGVDLSGVDLSGSYLNEANLNGANLSGANLNKADLSGANLRRANLSGANLRRTVMLSTVFANVDLRQTTGLVEIQHRGPSIVQLHTIQLPQDGSALHFLRGAGVPDEYINTWRTTMMYPVQYHSLFISYSSKDDVLARRLHADLQDHGVRCWFAPEDMKIGDEIRSRIDEAIHLQEKLLLLLSEHSLASTWVKNEVEAAFEKEEKQQRLVLFPIRLDESVEQTTKPWAATLRRTRHIGNFTCWTDPKEYQQAFERLLRDLKKADEQQDQEMKP